MIKNTPVFYLKIHTNTDFAIKCFNHWVDIAEAYGTGYYIVCDNNELKERVITGKNADKFITSSKKAEELLCDIIKSPRWLAVGIALLTPFIHAEENDIDCFFNIDADDTVMCCDAKHCAAALSEVKRYADISGIDCFSLDMHSSAWERFGETYWSFGVAYIKKNVDYIAKLLFFREHLNYYYSRMRLNGKIIMDEIFTLLGNDSQFKTETFYIENMYFRHNDFYTSYCYTGKLYYKEISQYQMFIRCIRKKQIGEGIDIPERFISINTDITQQQSLKFLTENKAFSYFDGRLNKTHNADIEKTVNKLRTAPSGLLVLFGLGRAYLKYLQWLCYYDIEVDVLCDNSPEKKGLKIIGIHVISFDELLSLAENHYLKVIITSTSYYDEIYAQLLENNIEVLN